MNPLEWYEKYKYIIRQKIESLSYRKIYIAVSGGRDSVFLTYCLADIVNKNQLCILHMDHSQRGKNSDDDREFVVNLAKSLGVECHVTKVNIPVHTGEGGFENIAREKRYHWFKSFIKDDQDLLFCGHSNDDQIETILMKIYRGAGLSGLKGISFEQNLFGMRVIRPLLILRRKSITQYLKNQNIAWREDESNDSDLYFRNFIRQHICQDLSSQIKNKLTYVSMLTNELRNFFFIPQSKLVAGGLEFEENEIIALSNFELRYLIEKIYLYFLNNSGPDKKNFKLLQKFIKSSSDHLEMPGYINVYKAKKKIYFQYKFAVHSPQFVIDDKSIDLSSDCELIVPQKSVKDLIFRYANLKKDSWNGRPLNSFKSILQLPKWKREALSIIELDNEIIYCESCSKSIKNEVLSDQNDKLVRIYPKESFIQL